MRYTAHFYNAAGQFSFFRYAFRSTADACEDACDELSKPTRVGYRAEVHARLGIGQPSVIVATVNSDGIINYPKSS